MAADALVVLVGGVVSLLWCVSFALLFAVVAAFPAFPAFPAIPEGSVCWGWLRFRPETVVLHGTDVAALLARLVRGPCESLG